MASYIIFLDIDGVLTSERSFFAHSPNNYKIMNKFDPVAIDFFNKIHNTYDVEFVLISSWKTDMNVSSDYHKHWIISSFSNSGFVGKFADVWKVSDEDNFPALNTRAFQIIKYVEEHHASIEDYMIFDDEDYSYNKILNKKRFIKTSSKEGISLKNMKDAWSMLGSWKKR